MHSTSAPTPQDGALVRSAPQQFPNILYSASHSRVAPENVGLQKEQKCNTFASHTYNEVRLCILVIHIKEVGNTKK
jgi:hypothetical protein